MYSNKLITLFFLLPLLCHAVEFDETQYNDCKNEPMLCATEINSPKGNNSKSMWFDNGKLVFIAFTNQQMKNQGYPSLAMFISDDKISSTNIDEFLASIHPDKYRRSHDPRYKFLPLVCRTDCNPYSLFNIDSKFTPDEKDKIFFSIPTDNTDFYKSFYLNKDYIEGLYPN
ncbi:hypothetical protein QEO94_02005 [Kingella negevensis]|uniref:hypothetical protein n=1 Tax=Kingella negevensis TaxID=1522312 RepID=UPI002543279F|nr:hypothetical protein [Kingella negevensis]WII93637.1 hypothetical protein QEO94_02005 [Kingella negevensis]